MFYITEEQIMVQLDCNEVLKRIQKENTQESASKGVRESKVVKFGIS